ncbi:hypothetical protein AAY473_040739 [Plecturocebus cupreus]
MSGQPVKAQTPAERSRSAWNTLCPIASPKRSQLRMRWRESSCSSEVYEVEMAGAPDPTALEPAQSHLGASDGRDQKTPKDGLFFPPYPNAQFWALFFPQPG